MNDRNVKLAVLYCLIGYAECYQHVCIMKDWLEYTW